MYVGQLWESCAGRRARRMWDSCNGYSYKFAKTARVYNFLSSFVQVQTWRYKYNDDDHGGGIGGHAHIRSLIVWNNIGGADLSIGRVQWRSFFVFMVKSFPFMGLILRKETL